MTRWRNGSATKTPGAGNRHRTAPISRITGEKGGIGVLIAHGFGDVVLTVGRDCADDDIMTGGILARRIKSRLINDLDIAAGADGPVLLRAHVRGESITRAAAAKCQKQHGRR